MSTALHGVTPEELERGGYLISPAALAEHLSNGRWIRARHHELISLALVEIAARRNDRLIITAPPQSGKSELTSHWFPCYALAHNPKLRIGLANYADEWARHWGRQVRTTMFNQFPAIGVGMGKYSKAAYRWETDAGGGMYCAGIGGGWAGHAIDLMLLDDPVKNAEEAASEVIQKRNWLWWTTNARARLRPGDGVVIITTRWHEEDLAGKLIAAMKKGPKAEGYEKWTVLNLPALGHWMPDGSRMPDVQNGTALWPEVFPEHEVRKTYVVLGSSQFSALYQGDPVPEEGHIIKREWCKKRYLKLPDDLDQWLQSWDTTLDDTTGADNVSGLVWARKGAVAYLADRFNGRIDFPATLEEMRAMTRRWPKATLKVIEKAASGPAAKRMLDHEIHGIVLEPVSGTGGKARRLKAVSPLFEAGNVIFPDESIAPWLGEYLDELCGFPTVAHDDDVDSTSQGLARLMPGLWAREEEAPPAPLPAEVRAAELKRLAKEEFWKRVASAKLPPTDDKPASVRMLEGGKRRR